MALQGALRIHRLFQPHYNVYGAQNKCDRPEQKLPLSCYTRSSLHLFAVEKPSPKLLNAIGQNSSLLCEEQSSSGEKQSQTSQFMFHTEGGGQVRVFVQKLATKHVLNVEARVHSDDDPVFLHWGLFRSDSADWIVLEADNAPSNTVFISGKDEAMRTQLQRSSSDHHTLHLELLPEMVPSYVSFVLYQPASPDHDELWIRRPCGSNFCVPVGLQTGRPEPLGVTLEADGSVNFALYSKHATSVTLCLYNDEDVEPGMEIDLDASVHRSGDVWHVKLPGLESFARYGYRCKGEESWENGNRFQKRRVLLDPYAKFVASHVPGQEELPSPAIALGVLRDKITEFPWEDDSPPCIPLSQLIVYRLDVAALTSSGVEEASTGSLLGLVHHLKFLGVNAVIFKPCFSHDKTQGPYYPQSFFSPMVGYDRSLSAGVFLKNMVKILHENKIEVLLDVVYTQTAENGDEAPETISFRGIDNQTYYILDPRKKVLMSEPGGANLFNCNEPSVHKMIIDSLRYWVEEYHVDGFCFVDASGLLRGPHGEDLSRPLLVEAISFDPVLSASKLIADPCSPAKPNVLKSPKFPHWKRWCELNTEFYNDVNNFFAGKPNSMSGFATRFCGSADRFSAGRGPAFSLNYVSNSYEPSLDDSFICGEKPVKYSDEPRLSSGDESEDSVLALKQQQVRNLLVTLFFSQGVPVLNLGDELHHRSNGGKPRELDWSRLEDEKDEVVCQIISSLSALRVRRGDLLQRNGYIEARKIRWQGLKPGDEPLWEDPNSSFLGVTLKSSKDDFGGDIFLAFNSQKEALIVELSEPPAQFSWHRVVDTSLPHPETITSNGAKLRSQTSYEVQPFSVLVLEAYPNPN